MESGTNKATELPPVAKEYNGINRNAWVFGWNPQQKLTISPFAYFKTHERSLQETVLNCRHRDSEADIESTGKVAYFNNLSQKSEYTTQYLSVMIWESLSLTS